MEKPIILIIDDDPGLRKTLSDILVFKGYETLTAGDGTEGLALLRANTVSLALVDLMLPDITGLDLLNIIGSESPATEAIILTGHATLDSAIQAANKGAFSYLVKPYEVDQLLLLVKRAVEKHQAGTALRESEERFRRIFMDCPLGMAIIGPDLRIDKVNGMLCRMTGYSEEELASMKCADIVHPADIEFDMRNFRRLLADELPCCKRETRCVMKNGESLQVGMTVSLIRDEHGACPRYLAMIEDISERKRFEEQLEYQANHDALTSLPNRNLLADRIRQALHHALRYHRKVAILYVDLDNFKFINDSLGHDRGDRLLKTIAERLQECVRSGDTVARQGGDDFVIVLSDMAKGEHAAKVAQKIQAAVCRPVRIDEHDLQVTCSTGISIYPSDGEDEQTLLKNADAAMYRAKEQGRNTFRFFTGELNVKAAERMTMEKHMRRALERGEFLLHYQPQVDLNSGRIAGMEALLRWRSAELGLVAPTRFIPLAEETGLIVPIGEWVLRTACEQNMAWRNTGHPNLVMAVNLSPRQFRQERFVESVARILRETGTEPLHLDLEIVESLLMSDAEGGAVLLKELNKLGMQLTMDDFGTGFSSLSYLQRFRFDKLKIDRCFIRNITSNPDSAAIVRAIIALAHSLKLEVIAEGVETEGQLRFLRYLGCDKIQGFYFSRPVPAAEFEQMLREDRRLDLPEKSGYPPERTVLLVDDEPQVIAMLKLMLGGEGYNVITAESADACFELLATNRAAVVVADLCMPGMNGTELLSRVKKLYPDVVRILLSGRADMNTLTDAINRGSISKFIIKPFEGPLLREIIKGAFREYEQTDGV
ncbi:MAG TPA: EAL domain-containing protein [Geobacteraceae bacterium]|nr:EAL domain-containing protein [Geobacteraceae bacterium]